MRICKIDGLLVIFGWINTHLRICSIQWCKKNRLPSFIHIIPLTFTANLIFFPYSKLQFGWMYYKIRLSNQLTLRLWEQIALSWILFDGSTGTLQPMVDFIFSSPTESNCSHEINKLTNNSHLNFHTLNKWPHRPVWWCSFLCII